MKRLFLFLLMACALVSCDISQARKNLKEYIITTEETKLPIVMQNITINSPEVLGISIDSVTLSFANDGTVQPITGYLNTTWKIKKEVIVSEDYSNYSFLYDEFSDFETKRYLVELTDFKDADIEGRSIKYHANWPEKNPFKK